jgi:hypothetical protein
MVFIISSEDLSTLMSDFISILAGYTFPALANPSLYPISKSLAAFGIYIEGYLSLTSLTASPFFSKVSPVKLTLGAPLMSMSPMPFDP